MQILEYLSELKGKEPIIEILLEYETSLLMPHAQFKSKNLLKYFLLDFNAYF